MSAGKQDPSPTIEAMLADGRLVPAPRVTRDALLLAVEVLEAYEPDPDDPGAAQLAAVAAMLRKEARDRDVMVRVAALTSAARKQGLDTNNPKVKAVIRRAAEEQCQ